jgi:hypothetical protein
VLASARSQGGAARQGHAGSRPFPGRTGHGYVCNIKLAIFFKKYGNLICMASWGFLTNHARVLLYVAHDPGARLRDIAASLGITERTAHGIVTDLAEAGYVIREKDGRRNRYQVQAHLPVPEPGTREPAVGELVTLFTAQSLPVTGLPVMS